ncbi:MAG: nucleotidyltransferase [Phycisphaerales bacterium]|nr:nucleotidyltransferase [Phycisphaerales bacterium]
MLTVTEAFRKFRSRLELTQKEQDDASRRQKEIREVMNRSFKIADDFLTGSYKRWTKTKPLKDVDIFCVFHDDERPKYRTDKHPSVVLTDTEKVLAEEYGRENVSRQRRSVTVKFPVGSDEERVMSFDVVPAFTKSSHCEIPDTATTKGWTETNPKIHAEKATAANEAFGGEWKGMVRMVKRWNQEKDKPVKPSFLLEVMALQILRPPFGGDYPYEFMAFFATAADRIDETWPEPAGLGPPVSDAMTAAERVNAKRMLTQAHHAVREAIEQSRAGRNGDALRKYRDLFGDLFPLS